MSKIEQGNHIYNANPDIGEKDEIQNIKRIFLAIPEGIQNELERSPVNKWLHCFNTHATTITGKVEITQKDKIIDTKQEKFALKQLEILKERLEALTEIYPKSEAANVPDWIKEKLLNFLTWENILEKNKQDESSVNKIQNNVLDRLGESRKKYFNSEDGWPDNFCFKVLPILKDLESNNKKTKKNKLNLSDEERGKLKEEIENLLGKVGELKLKNSAPLYDNFQKNY